MTDNREYFDGVPMPTPEELAEESKKQKELLKWAQSLTADQINFLCDGGWYNNTIKGYLIRAGREVDLTHDQIKELLQGLRFALDFMDKEDADKTYSEWE